MLLNLSQTLRMTRPLCVDYRPNRQSAIIKIQIYLLTGNRWVLYWRHCEKKKNKPLFHMPPRIENSTELYGMPTIFHQ